MRRHACLYACERRARRCRWTSEATAHISPPWTRQERRNIVPHALLAAPLPPMMMMTIVSRCLRLVGTAARPPAQQQGDCERGQRQRHGRRERSRGATTVAEATAVVAVVYPGLGRCHRRRREGGVWQAGVRQAGVRRGPHRSGPCAVPPCKRPEPPWPSIRFDGAILVFVVAFLFLFFFLFTQHQPKHDKRTLRASCLSR